jgi:uncharacterized protein (TIGR03086 family)
MIAKYRRALDAFGTVIEAVRPDQWQNPTPCPDWTARDVAGHVIGGQQMLRAFATGAEPPNPWVNPSGFAGDDPADAWQRARETCLAQLTSDNLERTFTYASRQDTVGQFVTTICFDLLGHTWDLAQASDQHVILPADLVEEMLAWGRAGDAFLRRPGFLGPAVPEPDGADLQSQFIAFLGRVEPEADRQHRATAVTA